MTRNLQRREFTLSNSCETCASFDEETAALDFAVLCGQVERCPAIVGGSIDVLRAHLESVRSAQQAANACQAACAGSVMKGRSAEAITAEPRGAKLEKEGHCGVSTV